MLKSFLTIAFRNLLRQKGFAMITILGLTIGLTASALIILYIYHELGYDRFHENSDRIYRLAVKAEISGQDLNVAVSSPPFGPTLKADYPEVVDYTRINLFQNSLFTVDEVKFYEENVLFADSSFFNMFTVPMIQGDPSTALDAPRSIVLTESLAEKYFGKELPLGKIIRFNNQLELTVTGVCRDYPDNSHLSFNSIISFSTFRDINGEHYFDEWGNLSMYTYIMLDRNSSVDSLTAKIPEFLKKHFSEEMEEANIKFAPYLQSITSIHLHSDLMAEIGDNSNINYIYLLIAITLFILVLASINFMNLSTAKSANRAREVGIRKVVGSERSKLIIQFIGESIFISLLSLLIAFFLIELILPVFNNITGKSLDMKYILDWQISLGFFILAVLVGIFAGSYPAFYLSSFNPLRVLQGRLKAGASGSFLRNILVFVQFAISISLIIGTIVIYKQLQYVQNRDLGFDKENIVVIDFRNPETRQNGQILKNEFLNIPDVIGASLTSGYPGGELSGTSYFPEDYGYTEPWLIYGFNADPDLVDNTLKMKVTQGRNMSSQMQGDSNAVLINETLLNMLDWDDPIGKTIVTDRTDSSILQVVGVLKDFHSQSLHQQIKPIMIKFLRDPPRFILVKIRTHDSQALMPKLQIAWEKVNPEIPFDYHFIDERISQFYDYEKKMGIILVYFTIFALFIASLGLFGLASFMAEQRTKEIGIRKAMGSSSRQISLILSRDFSKPVLLANIIAWPVAWFSMKRWLQEFEYQTDIPYWVFVAAGVFALLLAIITVNIQTIRAASANPADALRYE
jgi:putative ABC transport system permease protein